MASGSWGVIAVVYGNLAPRYGQSAVHVWWIVQRSFAGVGAPLSRMLERVRRSEQHFWAWKGENGLSGQSPQSVRLWVSPLGRGSSEGLPAALTRRRDFNVLPIFGCILVESTRRLSVDVLHALDHRR